MLRRTCAMVSAWRSPPCPPPVSSRPTTRLARQRLVNVLTVRTGEVVYDRNGRALQEWATPGAYMGVR